MSWQAVMAGPSGRNRGSGNQQIRSAQSFGCWIALARRVALTLIDTENGIYAPAIVIESRHTIYYSPKYQPGPPSIIPIAFHILPTSASREADILPIFPCFRGHSMRRYWLRRHERLLECRREPGSKRPHASYAPSRTSNPAINQTSVSLPKPAEMRDAIPIHGWKTKEEVEFTSE